MKAHTPGKWHKAGREIRDEYGNKVAEAATQRHIVEGTTEANARLISTAPELLDLIKLINEAAKGHVPVLNHWLEAVTASAIAKATGRDA
jgi:hypothetical protein